MNNVYLSLGSNMGDKKNNILRAYKHLEENKDIIIEKKSSFYMTEPVGYEDQDEFVNSVILIKTELGPYELLDYCQDIEKKLKRVRKIRWGPRTIDIDILLYNDMISNDEKLIIPHPRMTERAFVMVPLKEISDNIVIHDRKIDDIIKDINTDGVRLI